MRSGGDVAQEAMAKKRRDKEAREAVVDTDEVTSPERKRARVEGTSSMESIETSNSAS